MKITRLTVQNFLGARNVDHEITTPITLFAGHNGAGKSSIQEAVRMVLSGESVRVGLKKDYKQLVTQGEKTGFVEIELSDGVRTFITLPDGKTTSVNDYVPPLALPYVLNAQGFSRLAPSDRRAFLFGLMGLSASGTAAKQRLLNKGCNPEKVDLIIPILRAGFDAACKEAQNRARDEKAVWRGITGETYGEKKAASWMVQTSTVDTTDLANLRKSLVENDAAVAVANQKLGALQSEHKRHAESAQKFEKLNERARLEPRITEKLARDELELKQWQEKVNQARLLATNTKKTGLIHELALATDNLVDRLQSELYATLRTGPEYQALAQVMKKYFNEYGEIIENQSDTSLIDKLPEWEKALQLLQNTVANDKRDLADAQAAKQTIAELSAATGSALDESALAETKQHLDDLLTQGRKYAETVARLEATEKQVRDADVKTQSAAKAHQAVAQWSEIADALAPEGIPGEMLAEALTPLNDRLELTSDDAEWLTVSVGTDMEITAQTRSLAPEVRPYALLSESEQWRVDAMIAEAISHLSGLKLLVLDRFDVLDLQGRDDLVAWLDILAQDGDIDTALIFGTLKSIPSALPPTFTPHWIENGVVRQTKQAA